MNGKRQETHCSVALETAGEGEALSGSGPRAEPFTANPASESPAFVEQLMEEVCNRENLEIAWKRVRRNKGSPGVDGMTIDAAKDYLREQWPSIRSRLLDGTYQPLPVKRVEIPKPDGGVRKLGVPCVVDRLIQQALLQVLQKQWDPTLSAHSYGFRPGRSAHQAVAQACTKHQAPKRASTSRDSNRKDGVECGLGRDFRVQPLYPHERNFLDRSFAARLPKPV